MLLKSHFTRIAIAATALALLLPGVSDAQRVPFTILSPTDGATVRGKVRVRVNSAAIPADGYIAVFVNNRFISAVHPSKEGVGARVAYLGDPMQPVDEQDMQRDRFTIVWDSEEPLEEGGKPLPDGAITFRLALYGQDPMPIGESEVRLKLDNESSPDSADQQTIGRLLRYQFRPGQPLRYIVYETDLQTPGTQRLDNETNQPTGAPEFRETETVQTATRRAKHLLIPEGTRMDGSKLLWVVRQRTLQLREQIQENTPSFIDLEGFLPVTAFYTTLGEGLVDLKAIENDPIRYRLIQLPVLPERAVRPGDVWYTTFVLFPGVPVVRAKNEFVRYEWENNIRTVRVKQTFELEMTPALRAAYRNHPWAMAAQRAQMEASYWFAYETGTLVRCDASLTLITQTPIPMRPLANGTLPENVARAGMSGGTGMMGGMPGMPGGMSRGGTTSPMMGGMTMPPMGGAGGTTMPPMMGGMTMPPMGGAGGTTMPPMMGGGMTMPPMMGGMPGMPGMTGRTGGTTAAPQVQTGTVYRQVFTVRYLLDR